MPMLSGWLLVSCSTFLGLRFHICKMGMGSGECWHSAGSGVVAQLAGMSSSSSSY